MSKKPEKTEIAPWTGHPFANFRKEMDDLIENFFGRPFGQWPKLEGGLEMPRGVLSPAIDVSENDDAITLTAELPGLSEDDVDLDVKDGMLTLKGEKKMERDEKKEDTHITERRYGSFRRSMTVPDRVDLDKIKADFDKGVLTVTMPKKAEAKAAERKIAIGGKKK